MGVQCAIHENVQIVSKRSCYATRRTHGRNIQTGHVTVGGSMCTELLTPGGWQPMTVHALLLTVCQMLRQGEAQIQLKPDEHCM